MLELDKTLAARATRVFLMGQRFVAVAASGRCDVYRSTLVGAAHSHFKDKQSRFNGSVKQLNSARCLKSKLAGEL